MNRREFIRASVGSAAAAWAYTSSPLKAEVAGTKPYKIIGFSKAFQNLNAEDTADTVAEIGWDGIECPVRPNGQGQIEPERAADELPKMIESLKKRGKELTLVTTAINRLSDPHAESLLRTLSKLGIRKYRLGFYHYSNTRSIPDQLKSLSEDLRAIAQLNQELGLQAGFQNHSGKDLVGAAVWDIWTIMRDLPAEHLGVCFDIGHATIEGGLSWPTDARLMEGRMTAVYIKDFLWQRTDKGWKEKWVMLGEGMVNPAFFKWLKSTAFDGPISQHHEYDHGKGKPMIEKMKKDLAVLKTWLNA